MKYILATMSAAALFALAGCSNDPAPGAGTNAADDFASRINGGNPAGGQSAQGAGAPTVAQPLPNAADGVFPPGTVTDPASTTCGANLLGPFIGKVADARTRIDIEDAAGTSSEIRFVRPGGKFIRPDARSPRLNIMLDSQDIIRDARCG